MRLGRQLRPTDCAALADRIDSVMMGAADVDYSRLRMSLATGGQAMGHHAATLDYQKIQGLEHEPLFERYMRSPLVRHAAAHALGAHAAVAVYRAMFFNKPSAWAAGLRRRRGREARCSRGSSMASKQVWRWFSGAVA